MGIPANVYQPIEPTESPITEYCDIVKNNLPVLLSEWANENYNCLYTEGVTKYYYATDMIAVGQFNLTVIVCCDAQSNDAVFLPNVIPSNYTSGDGFVFDNGSEEEVIDGGREKYDSQIMLILTIGGLGLCVCIIGAIIFCRKKRDNKPEKKRTSIISMMRANKANAGQKHNAVASSSHWTQPSGDTAEIDALNL